MSDQSKPETNRVDYPNATRADGEPTDENLIWHVWRCTQLDNQKPIITLEKLADVVDIDEDRLEERLQPLTEESPIVVEQIDIDGTPVYASSEFADDMVMLGLIENRELFDPDHYETPGAGWTYTTHGTRDKDGWRVPRYPPEVVDNIIDHVNEESREELRENETVFTRPDVENVIDGVETE